MKILLSIILLSSFALMGCSTSSYGHRGHHKKHWKMMDADSDGVVTKAEFTDAHEKKFKAMDADGDGKITKDEKKAYKKSKCKKKCDKSKKKACCEEAKAKKEDCKSC